MRLAKQRARRALASCIKVRLARCTAKRAAAWPIGLALAEPQLWSQRQQHAICYFILPCPAFAVSPKGEQWARELLAAAKTKRDLPALAGAWATAAVLGTADARGAQSLLSCRTACQPCCAAWWRCCCSAPAGAQPLSMWSLIVPSSSPLLLILPRCARGVHGRHLPVQHLHLPARGAKHARPHLWRLPHAVGDGRAGVIATSHAA